jgi:hypothetical protein
MVSVKIGHFESFFGLPLSEALSETLSTVAQLQGLNADSSKAQSLREGAGTGSLRPRAFRFLG